MKNRLSQSASPYLLQHASNPVNWYPWSEEALSRAKSEKKPIFLSSGYAACHWCHVMEKESFSDPKVAEILNENFIPIKLDREERPDIDAFYMKAVQVLTGQGGWPLNVFLTPELRPFFGGTYFPPEPRHGMPSFSDLLVSLSTAYKERADEVRQNSDQLSNILFQSGRYFESSKELKPGWVDQSVLNIKAQFDSQEGGLGEAPKFFHVDAFRLLLRSEDSEAHSMVKLFLDRISAGGIHDQVAGGFHRYSTDRNWSTPHYEKMLYDNALLAELFTESFRKFGQERDRWMACLTIDWVIREMQSSDFLFYSSMDADTGKAEGAFYLWSDEELQSSFKDTQDWEDFQSQFRAKGTLSLKSLAKTGEEWSRQRTLMAQLLEKRGRREKPAIDYKVQTSWNALFLKALVTAGFTFERMDYAQLAVSLADSLWEKAFDQDHLKHVIYEGSSPPAGFLEDAAFFAEALLECFFKTNEIRFYERAKRLANLIADQFFDEEAGGFWMNSKSQSDVLFRFKEIHDSAMPSAFSAALSVFSKMNLLSAESRYAEIFDKSLQSIAGTAQAEPGGFQSLALLTLENEHEKFLFVSGEAGLTSALRKHFEKGLRVILLREASQEVHFFKEKWSETGLFQLCDRKSCQAPQRDWHDLLGNR